MDGYTRLMMTACFTTTVKFRTGHEKISRFCSRDDRLVTNPGLDKRECDLRSVEYPYQFSDSDGQREYFGGIIYAQSF